ncbi:MAG TPA: lipopolysaccharide heptosyltransferase II [Chlamydiales bacterium]|nr:lipopolysaccharide heptosyltransferase II [Chlamydiales bacterium]
MDQAKNILVRMPNWIGDLVMATPVLTDLRKAFPKASITAMCRTPQCELLKEDEAIDELFCFTRPPNDFLRREERRNIIAKIEAGKYDVGILLTNSFSSAWRFWQGKVKRRIGFACDWRSFFLTDAVKVPKEIDEQHIVITYKQLLAPLGIDISDTKPRLYVTPKEVEESKELLYQRGYVRGKKLVGINPGAAYGSSKCWPPERFRELAIKLAREVSVVFFGDSTTTVLVKEICRGLPEQVMDLAGVTSLRELACLIKDCDVLVTNDSGPMHIGAAFGTPLVALFGSTDEKVTGPYGQEEAVIHKHVSCSPCFKRTCPIDFRCMKQISVDEVAAKVLHLLKRGARV